MENQRQATLPDQYAPHSYRTTARVVGVVYIAGMVLGVIGNLRILSILGAPDPLANVAANSIVLAIAAILWLVTVAGDAAHGILMFPVLKPHSERIAVGYLGARIIDAVVVAIMALLILFQIPLAREYLKAGADTSSLQALSTVFTQAQLYAYHFGMIALGLAGLMLCYLLYRAKLIPQLLGVWGLIGYAVILGGSVFEVLGFDLRSIHTIPGGLWELFIGAWLIVKGFSSVPIPAERTPSSTTPIRTSPAVDSAPA
jgi:hypothetical protein